MSDKKLTEELENHFANLSDLQIKDKFKYLEDCGKGKYGLVVKIKIFPKNTSEKYDRAIKFSLPENFKNLGDKLKEVRDDFLSEIKILYKLKHPNLPQIYEFGKAKAKYRHNNKNDIIPYYVMEYLKGKNLKNFIENNQKKINENFFFRLVEQTLSALSYCHQHNILHLDIKPDNIFVDDSDEAEVRFVLADFGKSKNIKLLVQGDYIQIGGSFNWIHPDLYPSLKSGKLKKDLVVENGYLYDLYALGRVFKYVLEKIPSLNKTDSHSHWDFFINDLCWDDSKYREFSKLIDYSSTKEVFTKALKLINFNANKELSFLSANDKISTIRLSEDETMPFPIFLKAYIDTPEFQKLRNINQLAGTDLVYPGATHTRFVHSLGVYSKSILYVNSLQNNSLFYYLYDDFEIQNLFLCALLHDVGHYPFSHYLEEIEGLEKKIKDSVRHENLTEKIFKDKLSLKEAINNRKYDKYAKKYLSKKKLEIAKKMCSSSVGELLLNEERKENVLDIWSRKIKYKLFRDIISSSIDCDKLDYLLRDSKYAGVTYGKMIDMERFIMSLTINYKDAIDNKDTKKFPKLDLAITPKGVSAVESIISSRYSLFSEVYWHKTCRATTAMIKDAFWYAHENMTEEEFEWASLMLNDDEFLLFIAEKLDIEIATDLLGGIKNGYSRQIYKRLETFSKPWNRGDIQYDDLFKKLTENFSVIHSKKDDLIVLMNKEEKSRKWKEIKKHHLIIDVPDKESDSKFQLKVKYSDNVRGEPYYDFDVISPSKKVDINIYKKIRFFCHPDYYKQINALEQKFIDYIQRAILI